MILLWQRTAHQFAISWAWIVTPEAILQIQRLCYVGDLHGFKQKERYVYTENRPDGGRLGRYRFQSAE
jgi:hypothetical protein